MITPQELPEKEFSRVIRGYSVSEVDSYFDEIKDSFTQLYEKNAELVKVVAELTAKNAELLSSKPTPVHIITQANAEADKIISDANEEAAIIIASAKTSCDNLLNEFRYRLGMERDKLVELQTAVKNFKSAIYTLYQEHIDSVESIVDEADFEALDMEAQEYSTKVVSDIKTEVAYMMAELDQRREREAGTKIAYEYFEHRDEELAEELSEEESTAPDATVVFDPDIDLSDLPEEMDDSPAEDEDVEAIDITFEDDTAQSPVEEEEIPVKEPEIEVKKTDYDDVLEQFAEELRAESEERSNDNTDE